MRQYADSEGGQDLYVRAAASDLDQSPTNGTSKNGSGNNVVKVVSITISAFAFVIILMIFFYLWRKKMQQSKNSNIDRTGLDERSHDFMMNGASKKDYSGETTTDDLELPLFDFTTLAIATNNFLDANKLGQGGFGCVYKGTLMEGQIVAVKRLSRTSGQGIEELKNEIWNLWKEGNALELVDESIGIEFSHDEVLRCIQVGLLCVQEHAEDRPNMSKVLLMLSSDAVNLPQPKYPGFGLGKRGSEKGSSSKQDESLTLNELSVTILDGR
ncbi:hypothetical protein M8C21_007560 [Ambrosia artemisiifolia]|uniref:Uncharacterized protein n=1 Tax=Ambrosia artemisiifolia TaxID=4212 RepID=A0AAD5GDE4_AMBAR|nr:hypothetical protein M8C21_007560 [Ambrosia artemisiifolia]